MRSALIIGIDYVGTNNELFGCVNDANSIYNLLKNQLGYDCSLLITRNKYSQFYPSKENILQQIKAFVEEAKNGDDLFMYYSGHGTQITNKGGDVEKDGMDECIITADNKFITDDELKIHLVNNIPFNAKLSAVFDCCSSGTMMDLKFMLNCKTTIKKQRIKRSDFSSWIQYFRKIITHGLFIENVNTTTDMLLDNNCLPTKGTVILLSGCKDDEYSVEIGDNSKENTTGLLTTCFIESISEKDPNISCIELMNFLKDKMKEKYKGEQNACMSFGRWINLNDPFLTR